MAMTDPTVAGSPPLAGGLSPSAGVSGPARERRVRPLAALRWVVRSPWSLGSVVGGLVLWEVLIGVFDVSSLLAAPPSVIVQELIDMAESGELWKHSRVSAQQFATGYVGCALVAIPLGLLMGSIRPVRQVFQPWIAALYATPSISLAPLFIIWLGFGVASKAAVVALMAFFPIVINTVAGVDSLERYYNDVSSAFAASSRERFFKVLLPGSIPSIFTGLRLAVGRGLVGLVAGDLFGARAGIGFLILRAAQTFNTPQLFAGTIVLSVTGVVLTALLVKFESLLSPWKKAVQ